MNTLVSMSFASEHYSQLLLGEDVNKKTISVLDLDHDGEDEKMIKHIVLVKFMKKTMETEIDEILHQLRELEKFVPGMLSFSAGKNDSIEGLGRGYSHAFVIDFENIASRDAYLAHPEHIKLAQRIIAACEKGIDDVLVFDISSGPMEEVNQHTM